LLDPGFYKDMDGVTRRPNFAGTLAAWSGLVVAETLLLAGRPLASIRISACLASATYAVGRAKALWGNLTSEAILDRFDAANRLCRGREPTPRHQDRLSQVRSSFVPIWACLAALNGSAKNASLDQFLPLVMALDALRMARASKNPNEAGQLVKPLIRTVPEIWAFDRLQEMAPEARLKLFDELVVRIKETDPRALARRNALALATGYLATVAAGGSTSLALVEDCADQLPELTGWAYLIGGIGEGITWTSGFDGLGRLIARELHRPLRLEEPPTCDFALDEATVLADGELKEPLVHLKIKQAKVISVSIFPGVNIAIPIVDSGFMDAQFVAAYGGTSEPAAIVATEEHTRSKQDPLGILAEALWPHLRSFVVDETSQRFATKRRRRAGTQGNKRKGRTDVSSQLSLTDKRR
jgi:hypothetical protein